MPHVDPDRSREYKSVWARRKAASDSEYAAHRREQRRRYNIERRARKKKFLDDYKLEAGCVRCGYAEHPAALEFHHTDPTKKTFTIGVDRGAVTQRLFDEVAKCVVVCANCHRVEHFSKDTPN